MCKSSNAGNNTHSKSHKCSMPVMLIYGPYLFFANVAY